MDRNQLTRLIAEQYGADAEHPWLRHPDYAVFRRRSNGKWFALLMRIPEGKLGLSGDKAVDVLNVKCDPALIGLLRQERGVYPAYHMSKTSWVTLALDGGLEDDTIKWLLGLSYELAGAGKKRK